MYVEKSSSGDLITENRDEKEWVCAYSTQPDETEEYVAVTGAELLAAVPAHMGVRWRSNGTDEVVLWPSTGRHSK
ncbi:hypothetical protein MOQ72_26885 [Saccharopolyspora sp. K220]|uniref:hypothetical protein n=1 Tax=Saccharopolyspora soli TaxID=2926618 RepID=UPI001F572200|nr:hypothetical protein [Saccharopolyspora soli]MCI2421074.1 hypothetical protein [Saccharopolyspora soli]